MTAEKIRYMQSLIIMESNLINVLVHMQTVEECDDVGDTQSISPTLNDDELQCDKLPSDLTIDHHPLRNGPYDLVEDDNEQEQTFDTAVTSWIVDDIDMSHKCNKFAHSCIKMTTPESLSDMRLLQVQGKRELLCRYHTYTENQGYKPCISFCRGYHELCDQIYRRTMSSSYY